jgi:predicted nucleic acid-binding protein
VTQVFDASAVVSLLVDDGPDGRWLEERLTDTDLVAPHHMPVEVANVLRRMERSGALDRSEAGEAVGLLRLLDVDLVAFEPLAERAWALRGNLTSYDACYVAAAELVDGRLVTLDGRLQAAPGIRCPVVLPPIPPE